MDALLPVSSPDRLVIAFERYDAIATGPLADVAVQAKPRADARDSGPILVFDASTSEPVEIDFRGSVEDVRARLLAASPPSPPRSPGRPRLGVIAREVTLLPRHWEWLAQQRGGASGTLRRLVDAASRVDSRGGAVRNARDVTYRFMSHIAGDLPGFEAATRALYAGDPSAFAQAMEGWPPDVRAHVTVLSRGAFS